MSFDPDELLAEVEAEFGDIEAAERRREAAALLGRAEFVVDHEDAAHEAWRQRRRVATLHTAERVCPICGGPFVVETGRRGRPRVHCSDKCTSLASTRAWRARDVNSGTPVCESPKVA